MRSKILSVAVALSWFDLVIGWYVFSATHFFLQGSILEPFSLAEKIISICWLTVPPVVWWSVRRVLIRNEQWHRAGTIVFCICHVLSFPCLYMLGNTSDMFGGWSTVLFMLLNVEMVLAELLILLFKWNPARRGY